ncbi:hypothetical protein NDU88_004766 [Pleurodeles waltl]|uniref:Uncharacterized protein n=1 Tax=Pleurodeles waltl TaxID=8319 RepID=A0AAV7W5W9_PLEWA|nr:hypothetical protein NDU88_004766 [Pleurodeles waltl]
MLALRKTTVCWHSCKVLCAGTPEEYHVLTFLEPTVFWHSGRVLCAGIPVKYHVQALRKGTMCWHSRRVPCAGTQEDYYVLAFLESTVCWQSGRVPCAGTPEEYRVLALQKTTVCWHSWNVSCAGTPDPHDGGGQRNGRVISAPPTKASSGIPPSYSQQEDKKERRDICLPPGAQALRSGPQSEHRWQCYATPWGETAFAFLRLSCPVLGATGSVSFTLLYPELDRSGKAGNQEPGEPKPKGGDSCGFLSPLHCLSGEEHSVTNGPVALILYVFRSTLRRGCSNNGRDGSPE